MEIERVRHRTTNHARLNERRANEQKAVKIDCKEIKKARKKWRRWNWEVAMWRKLVPEVVDARFSMQQSMITTEPVLVWPECIISFLIFLSLSMDFEKWLASAAHVCISHKRLFSTIFLCKQIYNSHLFIYLFADSVQL